MTDQKNVLGWQDLGLGSFSSEGKKIYYKELDFQSLNYLIHPNSFQYLANVRQLSSYLQKIVE